MSDKYNFINHTERIRLAGGSMTSSLGLVSLGLSFGTYKGLWQPEMVVVDIEVPVIIGVDFEHICVHWM